MESRAKPTQHPSLPLRRRLAVAGGLLLLFTLVAAGPAWGAQGSGPARVIFDPNATPSWEHAIRGSGTSVDIAADVVLAPGGVAYVGGTIGGGMLSDVSLMKYVDGQPAWPTARLYNGPQNDYDSLAKLALSPNAGAIYGAGSSVGAGTTTDILLIKWKPNGTRQWTRRWDGSSNLDQSSALGVDSRGNVYVAGITVSGMTPEWIVVSWSSSGALRWAKRLSSSTATSLIPVDLVVTGTDIYVTANESTAAGARIRTVRYTSSGSVKWNRTYAGPSGDGASVRALVARPGGGVYLCGKAESPATHMDGLVIGYTKGGTRDVFALDTGPGGTTVQEFVDLAVTSTGDVVAVGLSHSGTNQDCHHAVYSSDGTLQGTVTVPGAWQDQWIAVAADDFGGYYVTGYYRIAAGNMAIAVARGSVIAGGGGFTSLWHPTFVSEHNLPVAIAVQGLTAVVAGRHYPSVTTGQDQVVLGYSY
ncbi:MAG: hypothetical protein R2826_10990 [Thermoleophilia bacterium]